MENSYKNSTAEKKNGKKSMDWRSPAPTDMPSTASASVAEGRAWNTG